MPYVRRRVGGHNRAAARGRRDDRNGPPGVRGGLSASERLPEPPGLPSGVYNHVGVGYTRDANGDGTLGDNAFVAYTGALSGTGANPTPPGTILQIDPTGQAINHMLTGTGEWEQKARGRLFIGGGVATISGRDTATGIPQGVLAYNVGSGSNNPNPQLTFSVYNAFVNKVELNPNYLAGSVLGGSVLTGMSVSGDSAVHLDFYADETPDAAVAAPPGGRRYQSVPGNIGISPEQPLRDDNPAGTLMVGLNDGTYYDRNNSGWGDMDWTGSPGDDDEVMWSFVANPDSDFHAKLDFYVTQVNESFVMTWDAGTPGNPADDITTTVFTSGDGEIQLFSIEGQFLPGTSLAPAGKLDANGEGFMNDLLANGDAYHLSGDWLFGGDRTGAYDSDPNTWSLQQEPLGTVAHTRFSGPLIPEPMTLSILTAGMALIVLRRRRAKAGR